jgi:diadenosine tetraphosphate (Ap4A) HIT family hydrolase
MSMRDCAFCSLDEAVLGNELAYARFDEYPVCPGHLLVLTLRHVATWFGAKDKERAALLALIDEGKRLLDERYGPDGYNIGVNVGPPGRRLRICTCT